MEFTSDFERNQVTWSVTKKFDYDFQIEIIFYYYKVQLDFQITFLKGFATFLPTYATKRVRGKDKVET